METYEISINCKTSIWTVGDMIDYCYHNSLSLIDFYDIPITKFLFTVSEDAMVFKLKYGEYNGIKKVIT